MKIYDCKAYCINLQASSAKEREPKARVIGNPTTYICEKTDNRCVGSKRGCWVWSDDEINPKVIEKCPSRYTIKGLENTMKSLKNRIDTLESK